jgi:HEPN domain-containing protein
MDKQEKFEYWLDIAEYDLESARYNFETGRWLYVVFMCQQAIEKLVKGLYTLYIDDNVPRIHNISKLIKRFEAKLFIPVAKDTYKFLDNLTTYYFNTRYTDYKQKLSSLIKKEVAESILIKTTEVFAWLLTLKP